ncbi:hypothetical protein Kpol_1002p60 [Vanderwaltozyma polyspora DSM 70294]|uniref:Uncharacterized protein n=1 Tax=Vanderwaltozyma polyspora (strain ATCC 22028 / DSM 70294 / BCRC 21397 / CBS 2163 / NBRC 10782 / NRRL Y-8283 / UCD 57-17) TaxID=436907 RepID=A7TE91_VANPO|nr:uncharacterized protein Kpol_1002p60 [Vanderwaltozyma polyspora DSM 70294]EDO19413.1 hypothetical protein Kpol_1002p60 [Vanderwaltozyma polyspora DSM 70294]
MRVSLSIHTLVVTSAATIILLLISFSALLADKNGIDSIISRPVSRNKIVWDNFNNYTIDIDLDNSTAIFNSILNALKQGASDIHPLGVSYFPAVIPQGTLLYRTGSSQIPESFEWLAFDHEFSYNFGSKYKSYGRKSLDDKSHFKKPTPNIDNDMPANTPITHPPPKSGHRSRDSFLTFRATRDMNKFLYLDGASAAKTSTGEMDSQKLLADVAKVKLKLGDDDDKNGGNMMVERLYASRICKWGKQFGLDGIIRVEIGFEVVLCDFFTDSIELVSNITMEAPGTLLGLPEPTLLTKDNGWPINEEGGLDEDKLTEEQIAILDREDYWQQILENYKLAQSYNWLQAGNSHDSGEKRVKLDYRNFITGINRTYISPDPMNRRLLSHGMTWEKQLKMVDDLETVLKNDFDANESIDWQQVFEEIDNKFSPMLKVMNNTLSHPDFSEEDMAIHVTKYTLNFVARFFANKSDSADDTQFGYGREFAVYQYSKPLKTLETSSDFLIWSSSVRVVREIINVIYDIHETLLPIVTAVAHNDSSMDTTKKQRVDSSREKINNLVETLKWISLNYKCEHACDWDEICFTPSWGPGPLAGGFGFDHNNKEQFGKHYDKSRGRFLINESLQCVKIDTIQKHRSP